MKKPCKNSIYVIHAWIYKNYMIMTIFWTPVTYKEPAALFSTRNALEVLMSYLSQEV